MKWLCRMGWHRPRSRMLFFPGIDADFVTLVVAEAVCSRCGAVLSHVEWSFADERDEQ